MAAQRAYRNSFLKDEVLVLPCHVLNAMRVLFLLSSWQDAAMTDAACVNAMRRMPGAKKRQDSGVQPMANARAISPLLPPPREIGAEHADGMSSVFRSKIVRWAGVSCVQDSDCLSIMGGWGMYVWVAMAWIRV